MRRCLLVAMTSVISLVFFGCSRGTVAVRDPGLREGLDAFEHAVAEAKGNVEDAMRQPAPASPDEGASPEQLILWAVQPVVGAADELVRVAGGRPEETEARAVLTDAQELVKKTQTRPSGPDALQGLDQLKAKAEAMKARL